MTVIAWDGKTLAADKQGTYSNLARTTTKIYRLESNEIIAFCGTIGTHHVLLDWYKSGADREKWPWELQRSAEWANIIIADKTGVRFCDQTPFFRYVEDSTMAWGCGADFAIGAMAMGADAVKAVEIVSKYCEGCGCGVDSFSIEK